MDEAVILHQRLDKLMRDCPLEAHERVDERLLHLQLSDLKVAGELLDKHPTEDMLYVEPEVDRGSVVARWTFSIVTGGPRLVHILHEHDALHNSERVYQLELHLLIQVLVLYCAHE